MAAAPAAAPPAADEPEPATEAPAAAEEPPPSPQRPKTAVASARAILTEGVKVGEAFLFASVVDQDGNLGIHAYDTRTQKLWECTVLQEQWSHLGGALTELSGRQQASLARAILKDLVIDGSLKYDPFPAVRVASPAEEAKVPDPCRVSRTSVLRRTSRRP